MNNVSISIIIPLFNGSLLIGRCLDSIFNQDRSFDLEVIVIDDGSTDDSVKVVKEYMSRGKGKGKIILLQQPNMGPASARNKGIRIATGRYLAFLDADDYWLPEFLKKTVQFLQNNENVIAVNVGQIHKIPGKKAITSPSFLTLNPPKYSKPFVINEFYEFWAVHKHICTGSVLMQTEVVQNTGGQLEELRISQDLEFWAFLGTFGKWGFIPELLFVSDGGRVTKDKGWYAKNIIRWKTTPSIELFQKRTLSAINKSNILGFNRVTGWVAMNFTYCHIMANEWQKSHDLIKVHGGFFPYNKLTRFYLVLIKLPKPGFIIGTKILRNVQIIKYSIYTKFKHS